MADSGCPPEMTISILPYNFSGSHSTDDNIQEAEVVESTARGLPSEGESETKQRLLDALVDERGVVTMACRKAGVSRMEYKKFYNGDEKFRMLAEEVKECAIDYTESKLFENIQRRDTACILFYLETQGKERGYIKRTQTDKNINITLSQIESMSDEQLKEKTAALSARIVAADGAAQEAM